MSTYDPRTKTTTSPLAEPCDACNAERGQDCRPDCLGLAHALDALDLHLDLAALRCAHEEHVTCKHGTCQDPAVSVITGGYSHLGYDTTTTCLRHVGVMVEHLLRPVAGWGDVLPVITHSVPVRCADCGLPITGTCGHCHGPLAGGETSCVTCDLLPDPPRLTGLPSSFTPIA